MWRPRGPPDLDGMGTCARRWALVRYQMQRRRHTVLRALARRSEVFRRLCPSFAPARTHHRPTGSHAPPPPAGGAAGDTMLMAVALVALCVVVVTAVPAALLLLVLLPLGLVFPIVQLALSLSERDDDPALGAEELLLPWVLSSVHLVLVLLLLTLLPVVHRFQSLRYDLVPTSGLPAAFFSPVILEEMRLRLAFALSCTTAEWDHECCVCCCGIAPEDAFVVHGCGHLFHGECIAVWIRERPSCPLCRGPAPPTQLSPLSALL
mmetsp:Transcript_28708/g.73614  ORF Transcript_28708/g.73614 Transcript_28708/m.73614 type:complete len:264 (-) Transcript_28708:395-1186(-)